LFSYGSSKTLGRWIEDAIEEKIERKEKVKWRQERGNKWLNQEYKNKERRTKWRQE